MVRFHVRGSTTPWPRCDRPSPVPLPRTLLSRCGAARENRIRDSPLRLEHRGARAAADYAGQSGNAGIEGDGGLSDEDRLPSSVPSAQRLPTRAVGRADNSSRRFRSRLPHSRRYPSRRPAGHVRCPAAHPAGWHFAQMAPRTDGGAHPGRRRPQPYLRGEALHRARRHGRGVRGRQRQQRRARSRSR